MNILVRIVLLVAVVISTAVCAGAETGNTTQPILTSFDFNIVGVGLKASPDYQAVPKGIATKVNANFDAGNFNISDIIAQLPQDYTVRAELSGPAFQTPVSLVTKPGVSFDIPTLAITGRYTLANIRLVDGSGKILFGAVPQAVAIESIPDPLITSVTTRQLSVQELKDRGVTFDSSNFTAYEFTAGIATQSGQVPLTLPVVIPASQTVQETPTIDAPTTISLPQSQTITVPPDVPETAIPQNLEVKPFMMEVEDGDKTGTIKLPPIPGVVVIPGNIGFLHQYFSALALVSNGAPLQSGLTIRDVKAIISFPAGEDLTPGTDAAPGDDPLRMAKGASGYFPRAASVMNAGPDGKAGTSDDSGSMQPGESGQADFTVEGLKEGTHKVDFDITAILDGLPVGPVTLKGKASGAVLVRNPDFAVTLGHPATIRTGEEYDLFVTVTNTGKTIANLVTVGLDPRALSGVVFVAGESNSKSIDTILPGSAATVKFRLKSQRTGKVTATAFESPDVYGRFILRAGVGENNIPLSPDSLILSYTGSLPGDLTASAVGLLGQAWSVATAPTGALPSNVLPISKQTVTSRAYDLSEAGLRVLIGDNLVKAVEDLTFDFFGSDVYNKGFDSLRRSSTMGLELNRALASVFKSETDALGVIAFQAGFADKVSYRPAHLSIITSNAPLHLRLTNASGNRSGGLSATENARSIPYADSFALGESGASRSTLILSTKLDSSSYILEMAAEDSGSFDLGIVLPDANGVLTQYIFNGVTISAGTKGTLAINPGSTNLVLSLDDNGDGVADRSLSPSSQIAIPDHAPHIVAATQLTPGFGPGGDKHGRNVAVLFSERISPDSVQNVANYSVEENAVKQATLQPGKRMAFLLLRDGIGPFFERSLTVQGLTDQAGRSMTASETKKITITAKGPAAVVTGTVRTARGEPVPNATVRLYQLIWFDDGFEISQRYALFTEKQANADGTYRLEYVFQNDDPAGPFQLEVVNPTTGEVGSLTTGVIYHGQRLNLDLFMKARGSLSGVVRNEAGNPVGGATVQVITLADNRGQSKTTDATGSFSFSNLIVGAFSLTAVNRATYSQGSTMGTLPEDGSAVTQDVTIRRVADTARGTVSGKILEPDGITPRSGVVVIVEEPAGSANPNYRNWQRSAVDGSFSFSGVYAGSVRVTARDDVSGEQSEVSGTLTNGATLALNVIMKGTGSVTGVVKRDDGKSPDGLYAIVSPSQGQPRVVMTDSAGTFRVDGLPIGTTSVEILDPHDFNRTVAAGSVTILSSGSVANIALYVPLKALATGTIQGIVRHRDGTPWANAQIKRIVDSNHYYPLQADGAGNFTIPNLPLGSYRLSVVAGSEVINASTDLWYDTQVRTLELAPIGLGTVTGTTWDDAEKTRPTGADVTLYSMKPNLVGWLVYDTDTPTVVKSDPQTGRFTFNGIFLGSFTATSSNVFRPTPVSVSGAITANGQVVNIDLPLKGSQANPVNQPGSVSGKVLMPDGSPAGKDVRVTVTFGESVVTVTTDEQGLFHFAPIIPPGSHPIVAEDPATTLKWQGNAYVPSGLDVPVAIKLLGRGSITVKVLSDKGDPIPNAKISLKGTAYPNDFGEDFSDAGGQALFSNMSEGNYAVSASGTGSLSGLSGRNSVLMPSNGASVIVEVRLAKSATVTGHFLKADGVTPIAGGQVTLKQNGQAIAYASTSSDQVDPGRFQLEYVPLGDFTVEGYDPVTERRGMGGGRLSVDGETVVADVVVTPRGTVKGLVLNYGGTTPIASAPVSISVSGVTGFYYSSVSAPDGSFYFSGVPAGRYTVDATDPSNGLRGQANGSLSYENESIQTQVHIAPTGSIAGRVLMPDGATPAVTATVRLNGGTPLPVDPVTGSFRYDNLAAGRSYTLTSTQSNSRRNGSSIATVSSDLEIANGDIVLGGVGTVQGTVLDSDGASPLAGAKVELRFANTTLTVYTADNGAFSFGDIPTGAFTLVASHAERTTGASQNSYLQNEGQVATVNLVLGPIASVKVRVLMADGVTPSRGGGMRLTTNTGRVLTGITDSNGQYTFSSIPVPCNVSLYVEDAAGVGIGRAIGVLSQNEQVLDLGTIVLDDKPVSIISVNPASGSVSVPTNQVIKVVFSEAVDPSTITTSSFYLTQGNSRINGSLQLDQDNTLAIFTPASALKGFTLYTLVVTDGITDRVGRKLALPQSVSFTTIDNVPPTIVSLSPADAELQVAADAVVRVTFSEAVDPNTLGGITLSSGGTPVAFRTDLIQNGTVVALTPLEPLAYNRNYQVSASGVKDTSGNAVSSTTQATFFTIDTVPPTITAVTVPANSDLIKGNTVQVTAAVADSDVAFVDFYLDDQPAGKVAKSPFTLPLLLFKEGLIRIKAIAQDRVGNRGVAQALELNVQQNKPPQAQFVSPDDGSSVNTGAQFNITVQGSDDLSLKEFVLTAAGELTATQTKQVSGKTGTTTFTLTAPTTMSTNGSIVLSLTATDISGSTSQPVQRTLQLRDGIAPVIGLTSPGQTVKYKPGETAVINISASDNYGVSSISCIASNATTTSQTFDVSPTAKSVNKVFSFPVPANASPYASINVSCSAYDAAGKSGSSSLGLTVADVVPPAFISSVPANNATNVATAATLTVNFSESLSSSTVTTTSVTLAESVSGAAVPSTVTLSGDHKSIAVKPSAQLVRGTAYTLTISTAVTDDAGNALQAPYQLSFTADTAAPQITAVSPVSGSVNVPVGSAVTVSFNEQIDPSSVTTGMVSMTSDLGAVTGTLTVAADGLSLTFKPYNQLGYNRTYTFTLNAGVLDISGNISTSGVTTSFTTQGPDSDLVGYWPMDGDWTDYSGNGHNGTAYNGAAFSSDHIVGSQAGSFKGTGDYVSIGNLYGSFPNNAFAIESWVKVTDTGSGTRRTVAGGLGSYADYAIGLENNQFMVVVGNRNNTVYYARSGFIPNTTDWYHVVGTYDGGRLKLYVNGELKSDVAATWVQSNGGVDFYIGSEYCCSSNNYNGLIDDVSVYKRALLPEDVFEHYHAGLTTDRTLPAAPTVDPVPSSTYNNQIVLRGTKDAGSSIRVNGKQIVAHDDNTTWQELYQLNLGQNLLDVSSHDVAGNVSPSVNLVVNVLPSITNNPDIIGLWRMNGDWKDSSGNSNNVTSVNGATFVNGHIAGTMSGSFDGINDSTSTQTGYLASVSNTFTMAFWANPNATRNVTSESTGGTSGTSGQRYAIAPTHLASIGAAGVGVSVGTNGISVFEHTANYLPSLLVYNAAITGWNHVVVVYENKQPRLYLNGVLVRTGLTSSQSTIYPSTLFGDTSGYGPYSGLIDNVAIYKRVLTEQEISDLFHYQYADVPVVSITSPGQTTEYKPGETGTATVTASSQNGIAKLYCNASGAVSENSQVAPFDLPQNNVTQQFTFKVSTNATPYEAYRLSCIAETVSGVLASTNLDLQAADVVSPVVTGASIANNAIDVIATLPITVTFNEAMDLTSLNSGTVKLARVDSGTQVGGNISLSADGTTITFTSATPLDGSTTYRFLIQGARDLAGNVSADYSIMFTTKAATSALVENAGTSSAPYTISAGRYSTITLKNSFVVFDGPVAADSMTLSANSTLSHIATGVTGSERLDLVVTGVLSIDSTSKIDVSGRGYLGGYSGGNSSYYGRTVGNTITGGSYYYSGGSYGGSGGSYSNNAVAAIYGDPSNPNDLGSGGGSTGNIAGNGGGLVRIKTQSLTLDGSIIADGGNAQYSSGGGSGGGIRIDAATLSGSGYIYARGGTTQTTNYTSGGGGGGRIAIYYGSMSLPQANVSAAGGSGAASGTPGGAGTIYYKSTVSGADHLIVDNRGLDAGEGSTALRSLGSGTVTDVTPTTLTASGAAWQPGALKGMKFAPDVTQARYFTVIDNSATTLTIDPAEGDLTQATGRGLTYSGVYLFTKLSVLGKGRLTSLDRLVVSDELLVDGSTLLSQNLTADKLTIHNSGLLSQLRTTTSQEYRLELATGTLSIDSTSKIDVSSRGYLGGNSGGNSSTYGRTVGNTITGGSNYYGGGSYGGYGGSYSNYAVAAVYGDPANPNDLGSGGGCGNTGGNGGGLVRIKAQSLILDGSILADGGNAQYNGGGGSGGGIRIDATTLAGSGYIYARGGTTQNTNYTSGGGGGGRIAVYYGSMSLPQANVSAAGGSGAASGTPGGAGTVRFSLLP